MNPSLVRLGALPLICAVMALEVLMTHSNTFLFLSLNQATHALPPYLWSNLTVLGDAALTPLCLLFWWRRRPDLLWAGLLTALTAFLFSHGLKDFFNSPRPPAVLAVEVIGPRLLHGSFPSGHTTTLFSLAGLLILGLPLRHRGGMAALILLACAGALSRIALGVHWPLDVLVGAAGGWLSAGLGLAMAQRWPRAQRFGYPLALIILGALAIHGLTRGPDGLPGTYLMEKGWIILALVTAFLRR